MQKIKSFLSVVEVEAVVDSLECGWYETRESITTNVCKPICCL
jgi:hypothetical protein